MLFSYDRPFPIHWWVSNHFVHVFPHGSHGFLQCLVCFTQGMDGNGGCWDYPLELISMDYPISKNFKMGTIDGNYSWTTIWIIPSFPIWSTGKMFSYWSTVFWLLLGLRTSFTRTTRRSGMLDSSRSDKALKPERGPWELMALIYDHCRGVRIVVVWSSDNSIFEMILRVLICKK